MNPLTVLLARDLWHGKVSKRTGCLEVADLVNHLVTSGAGQPERMTVWRCLTCGV